MSKQFNVFISHYGRDDDKVQRLKQRLIDKGYEIRNSSIDSTKHKDGRIPSDKVVARLLRKGINWAGTFICLIGPDTHQRPWVNYEIRQAYLKKKPIIGIYAHGCNNSVELPETFKKYKLPTIGWNSLAKLGRIMSGEEVASENPDGSPVAAGYVKNIIRVPC